MKVIRDRDLKPVVRHAQKLYSAVRAVRAGDLGRDDIAILTNWCNHQREALWQGMNLQEILNVYRLSAEYDNFEQFIEDVGNVARREWNRGVRQQNKLLMVKGEG